MNLLYLNEKECVPEIDGCRFDSHKTDNIKTLILYLQEFKNKFKITGYGSDRLKKNLYESFNKERCYYEFTSLFYDGHICIKNKACERGFNYDYDTTIKKFGIKGNGIESVIELSDLLNGISYNSISSLGFDSLEHSEKISKYMSPKYIQINSNGDVFITSYATSDNKILQFILEEMHNRFIS